MCFWIKPRKEDKQQFSELGQLLKVIEKPITPRYINYSKTFKTSFALNKSYISKALNNYSYQKVINPLDKHSQYLTMTTTK